MKSKTITIALLILLLSISCEYKKEEVKPPPADVSFSNDVIPIFNRSCNSTSCHASGKVSPDLSPGGAYISLTSGGYVNDTIVPENCILYEWLTNKSNPMPPSGLLSEDDRNIIYTWIKKGLKDN